MNSFNDWLFREECVDIILSSSLGSLLIALQMIPKIDVSSKMDFNVFVSSFDDVGHAVCACWGQCLFISARLLHPEHPYMSSRISLTVSFPKAIFHSQMSWNCKLSDVAMLMATYNPAKSCAYMNW